MPSADKMFLARFDTPLGAAQLVCDAEGSVHLFGWYENDRIQLRSSGAVAASDPFGLVSRLSDYFAGDVTAIDTIPVRFAGTPFQISVWQALRTIPAGGTLSYGALANRLGQPSAMRAVGLANGANPIAVIVPCHRVIGADGSLTGYGGGLERKRWLLAHEAHHSGTGSFGRLL